jgi:hypothetical protein
MQARAYKLSLVVDERTPSIAAGNRRAQPRGRALRESQDRLQAILESEPECVKLVAADGTVLDMNLPV